MNSIFLFSINNKVNNPQIVQIMNFKDVIIRKNSKEVEWWNKYKWPFTIGASKTHVLISCYIEIRGGMISSI
jgi:SET domain-containing protein